MDVKDVNTEGDLRWCSRIGAGMGTASKVGARGAAVDRVSLPLMTAMSGPNMSRALSWRRLVSLDRIKLRRRMEANSALSGRPSF